jgi:hypothetical protein
MDHSHFIIWMATMQLPTCKTRNYM